MSTFLQEAKMGCWRSLAIRLIAVLIVVPLSCVLVFIPLWLVNQSDLSIWWLIIPASLFLLILFGGGWGAMALVLVKRTRHLDGMFVPMGLTGSLYNMFFRQYHGTVQNRQVEVYFHRGPTLEIDISTPLQTRLAVTDRNTDTLALARLLNRQPLELTDPVLSEFTAFALDEPWGRALLAQSRVPDLLRRLITFEGSFTRRQVLLRPGRLRLHLFGSRNLLDFTLDATQEQVYQWLDDLQALLRIAEDLPAPQITAEESPAERAARLMRNRNPYLIPAITIGAILLTFICAAVVGIAAFLWATSQ